MEENKKSHTLLIIFSVVIYISCYVAAILISVGYFGINAPVFAKYGAYKAEYLEVCIKVARYYFLELQVASIIPTCLFVLLWKKKF